MADLSTTFLIAASIITENELFSNINCDNAWDESEEGVSGGVGGGRPDPEPNLIWIFFLLSTVLHHVLIPACHSNVYGFCFSPPPLCPRPNSNVKKWQQGKEMTEWNCVLPGTTQISGSEYLQSISVFVFGWQWTRWDRHEWTPCVLDRLNIFTRWRSGCWSWRAAILSWCIDRPDTDYRWLCS